MQFLILEYLFICSKKIKKNQKKDINLDAQYIFFNLFY